MLPFPNAYSFTKRMAEHLLMEGNTKNVPITFIRPSIIGAAADEPCIGWTDTYGLLSGIALLTGLGILRDMTGNENNIADVIPVDYVAKQLLVQTAFAHNLYRSSQGQKNYFLTHCGTSSVNPVNWKYYLESLISYQNDFPYDKRVGKSSLVLHRTDQSYKLAYRLKSVIPTYTLFYLSRILGTKSFKEKITELKGAVDQCFTIKQELTYYASNEWIFDCSNTAQLLAFLKNDAHEAKVFNIDISKLKWRDYCRNFGYGIKHYILHEQAVVPSLGYGDAVLKMERSRSYWPFA